MTNQHGGPRPKTRPDDGRTNNRPAPGPGRKPQTFRLKLGDSFAKQQADADGRGIGLTELWTVEEISRTYVKLRCDNGDYVRLIR